MTTTAVATHSLSTPSTTVLSLTHLPNEIIRIIFEQLTHTRRQQDIARLRLVCKLFADIGNYYLLSNVYLFAKSSQYEQLRQISEHSIISKKVNTLFYEADMLKDCMTAQNWFRNIPLPSACNDQRPASPPPTANRREWRGYNRSLNDYGRHERRPNLADSNHDPHSRAQLQKAYDIYTGYLKDQDRIRSCEYNWEMLKDVMMKLPNLKAIEISTQCCPHIGGRAARVAQAFNDGMVPPYGDRQAEEGCGVGQQRALLLAADAANLNLETLAAGSLSRQFFRESTKQNAEVMKKLQRPLRYVRTLKLYIRYREVDTCIYSIPPQHAFHLNPHLKDFITATPALERLDISFTNYGDPLPPVSLCDSVGAYKWHSLRVAAFANIRANENCLVEFFDRHAGTLRKLRLETIYLTMGTWPSLFQRARRTLKLEQARVSGGLSSHNPFDLFVFDFARLNDLKKNLSQVMIEQYLLGSGDAPLLDLLHFRETYHHQYVLPDPDRPTYFDTESDEAIMDHY